MSKFGFNQEKLEMEHRAKQAAKEYENKKARIASKAATICPAIKEILQDLVATEKMPSEIVAGREYGWWKLHHKTTS